jgi:hypothetical protein
MLVDKNARHRNFPVVLEPETFFGQLQHIIVVKIGPSDELGLDEHGIFILAAIRCCDAKTLFGGDIYYYSHEGCLEVVDVNCIQCCVGRIEDGGRWAIIDRSGDYAHPVFVDDD